MDFENWNYFYIIAIVVILILIVLIILVFYFRSYIKKFEEENFEYINRYFKELTDITNKSKENWHAQVQSMVTDHNQLMTNTQKIIDLFLCNLEAKFNKHTEALNLNYTTYVEKLDRSNKQFANVLLKLNECVQNYNQINLTLVDSYKKLGEMSDKTKELLADHEKLILNHTSQYDELLSLLRKKSEDDITQITTDGEYKLSTLINQIENDLNSLSKEVLNQINLLFNGEKFAKFNENISFINQKFDNSFIEIRNELNKSNGHFEKIFSELSEEKKKGWFSKLKG